MKIKRALALLILAALLAGCGRTAPASKKYTVITTVFPAYDWAREIIGDSENVELILLSDKGVDLHSYQATAADMVKIAACDLFLYVGGESDEWVEEVLSAVPNETRTELSLMDILSDRLHEEEEVEGMQIRSHEDAAEEAYDEHVWLSVRNASAACEEIAEALCRMDNANASIYRENKAAYQRRLAGLDEAFLARDFSRDTLMFCDRFPFRYLVEDYKLRYYAAFSGCSGDSEASFATVLFLSEKAEELGLTTLLCLEASDGQIARTVAGCLPGQEMTICRLNSMQSVSLADSQNGITYLSLMEENLNTIAKALS